MNSTAPATLVGISRRLFVATLIAFSCTASQLSGQITATGDYAPTYDGVSDPWDMGSDARVGFSSSGSILVENGSQIISDGISLGATLSGIGEVTITGIGSIWNDSDIIEVTRAGSGTINILDGGVLNATRLGIGGSGGPTDLLGTGTVNVDGAGSAIIASSIGIGVNNSRLNITNGGEVMSQSLFFSREESANPSIFVSGVGSRFVAAGSIDIELGSQHESIQISVEDGGNFEVQEIVTRTHLALAASGSNSTIKANNVFHLGTGSVNITDGATYQVSKDLTVGLGQVSIDGGTVTAGGVLAKVHTWEGSGIINTNGLVADNVDLVFDSSTGSQLQVLFDDNPGQNITVNIDASKSTGSLGAGFNGNASITVKDGVTISSDIGYLGRGLQANGIGLITGEGSTWNVSRGFLMYGGSLHIEDGGTLRVGGSLFSAYETSIELVNGIIEFTNDDGRLWATNGNFDFLGGTIKNAATINTSTLFRQQGGILAPGDEVGITVVESDYEFDGGGWEIQLHGIGQAGIDYDQIQIEGQLDLVGLDGIQDSFLRLELGYAAEIGDSFIIGLNDDVDEVIGEFAGGPSASAFYGGYLFEFDIIYDGGSGNDIVVTVSSISSVPEPSAMGLGCIAMLLLIRKRRRR